MHPVSLDEVEGLAREHGVAVVRLDQAPDRLGRAGVSWINVALRLPDDGTGALPLLRHLVLTDQKSATYKLGLLRALCRAADGSAGLARGVDDDHVVLPLGLVALNWLRLISAPHHDGSTPGPWQSSWRRGLGVCRTRVPSGRGRCGQPARPQSGCPVWPQGGTCRALRLAGSRRPRRQNACHIPDLFIQRVAASSPSSRGRIMMPVGSLTLDAPYLTSFGSMLVPRDLWRAMQRFRGLGGAGADGRVGSPDADVRCATGPHP